MAIKGNQMSRDRYCTHYKTQLLKIIKQGKGNTANNTIFSSSFYNYDGN